MNEGHCLLNNQKIMNNAKVKVSLFIECATRNAGNVEKKKP